MSDLPKIVAVVGPTGSGKTDLALFLAKKFNGEIVNADSRQIYREADIGTDKPRFARRGKKLYVEGIRHHLFDIVSPRKIYTVALWKRRATRALREIIGRGKLPILVGGTGLYVQSLADNLNLPPIPPNKKLRARLCKKSGRELIAMLKKHDPVSADRLDPKNPRRIIRAIEVSKISGKPFSDFQKKRPPVFDILQIGIKIPREELYRRIDKRVEERLRRGLINETKRLIKKYGARAPALSGIGYREIADALSSIKKGELRGDTAERIKFNTHNYARRQLMWFRRDKRIKWVRASGEAVKLTHEFKDIHNI